MTKIYLLLFIFFSIGASAQDRDPWAAAEAAAKFPCVLNNTCDEILARHWTPAPTKEIRLAGRTLMNKKSNQHIGLACVGPNQSCETYRFIAMITPTEAYYMGPAFKVRDEAVLKKVLKTVSSKAKYNRTRHLGILFGYIAAISIASAATGNPLPLIIGMAAAGYFAETGLLKPGMINTNSGAQTINQDGWNWSIKPHPIRSKIFNNFLNGLSGNSVEAAQSYYIWEKGDLDALKIESN